MTITPCASSHRDQRNQLCHYKTWSTKIQTEDIKHDNKFNSKPPILILSAYNQKKKKKTKKLAKFPGL